MRVEGGVRVGGGGAFGDSSLAGFNSQGNLSAAPLLLEAVKCAVLLALLLVIGRGEGEEEGGEEKEDGRRG